MTEELQKIPETFRANGYDYELVERDGSYALYKQLSKDIEMGWEIHKIRVAEASERKFPNGKVHKWPRREKLANNEEFGSYGWSYIGEDVARTKFRNAVRHELSAKKVS